MSLRALVRFPSRSVVVGTVAAALLLAGFAPQEAAAERDDDNPAFHRLALDYLSLISEREPFESGAHLGGGLAYKNRVYWRDFTLSQMDFNLSAMGFIQFEGFRLEAMATYGRAFNQTNFAEPTYWEVSLNYLFRLDYALLYVGARRHGFDGFSLDLLGNDPIVYDERYDDGVPDEIYEAFVKLMIATGPIQGQGAVNIMYTVGIYQRFSEEVFDGTMVDFGFTTLSTNAWVLGDVLSLSGYVRWNQEYLQPWGRFSTYGFTAKVIKDVSSLEAPGRGPFYIELWATWKGALSERYDDDLIIQVGFWAVW